ncbi:hypothetical protein LINGRAHAP2_LOCUS9306 [Linum grandiflorum]
MMLLLNSCYMDLAEMHTLSHHACKPENVASSPNRLLPKQRLMIVVLSCIAGATLWLFQLNLVCLSATGTLFHITRIWL